MKINTKKQTCNKKDSERKKKQLNFKIQQVQQQ